MIFQFSCKVFFVVVIFGINSQPKKCEEKLLSTTLKCSGKCRFHLKYHLCSGKFLLIYIFFSLCVESQTDMGYPPPYCTTRPSKCLQHHQQLWCKTLWTRVNLLLSTYGVLLLIDFLVQTRPR